MVCCVTRKCLFYVFVYGLFNEDLNSQQYVPSNGKMLKNDDLERM
jgi:hypothetical protein